MIKYFSPTPLRVKHGVQNTVLISVAHLATALLFSSSKYRSCAGYVNPYRLCEPMYEWHVSDGCLVIR